MLELFFVLPSLLLHLQSSFRLDDDIWYIPNLSLINVCNWLAQRRRVCDDSVVVCEWVPKKDRRGKCFIRFLLTIIVAGTDENNSRK